MNTFTIEGFATECKAAMNGAGNRQEAARSYLEQIMRENDAAHIIKTLNDAIPAEADIGEMILHTSPELTMLYGRVPPRFQSGIHNHTVFACIGQLDGAEVNTIYEASEDGQGLQVAGTQRIDAGQVLSLPEDAIHHIENPNDTTGSALHIYGGDFNAVMEERSLWSFDGFEEKAFSFQGLVGESIKGMKLNSNQTGLNALAAAIPAARALINQ